jgi:hypothetical protein
MPCFHCMPRCISFIGKTKKNDSLPTIFVIFRKIIPITSTELVTPDHDSWKSHEQHF